MPSNQPIRTKPYNHAVEGNRPRERPRPITSRVNLGKWVPLAIIVAMPLVWSKTFQWSQNALDKKDMNFRATQYFDTNYNLLREERELKKYYEAMGVLEGQKPTYEQIQEFDNYLNSINYPQAEDIRKKFSGRGY